MRRALYTWHIHSIFWKSWVNFDHLTNNLQRQTNSLFWIPPRANQTRVQFNEFTDKYNATFYQYMCESSFRAISNCRMYKSTSNVWMREVNTKAQLALSLGHRSCVCPIPLACAHFISSGISSCYACKSSFFLVPALNLFPNWLPQRPLLRSHSKPLQLRCSFTYVGHPSPCCAT